MTFNAVYWLVLLFVLMSVNSIVCSATVKEVLMADVMSFLLNKVVTATSCLRPHSYADFPKSEPRTGLCEAVLNEIHVRIIDGQEHVTKMRERKREIES